jgi:hypothetical protein
MIICPRDTRNCYHDLFHAIDNPLLRITGRERGEPSPTCASVPRESDLLVSRLVSMRWALMGRREFE